MGLQRWDAASTESCKRSDPMVVIPNRPRLLLGIGAVSPRTHLTEREQRAKLRRVSDPIQTSRQAAKMTQTCWSTQSNQKVRLLNYRR